MLPANRSHTGFTLIELMVVVTIIALLAGMIIASVGMLQRNAKATETRKLVMDVSQAISQYLNDWAILGNATSSDFQADTWEFLGKSRTREKKAPYIDLTHKHLGIGDPPKKSDVRNATCIIDAWGDRVYFDIENDTKHGRDFTRKVTIRSQWGTSPTTDDRGYVYELGEDWSWED